MNFKSEIKSENLSSNKNMKTSHMCNDTLINPGRSVRSEKAFLAKSKPPNNPIGMDIVSEHKGTMMI